MPDTHKDRIRERIRLLEETERGRGLLPEEAEVLAELRLELDCYVPEYVPGQTDQD